MCCSPLVADPARPAPHIFCHPVRQIIVHRAANREARWSRLNLLLGHTAPPCSNGSASLAAADERHMGEFSLHPFGPSSREAIRTPNSYSAVLSTGLATCHFFLLLP
jgi:hypothetical protein